MVAAKGVSIIVRPGDGWATSASALSSSLKAAAASAPRRRNCRRLGSVKSSFTVRPLSYAKEDLATVHPEKKEPVEQQDGGSQEQWLQSWTKEEKRRLTQVGDEILVQETFP